MAVAILVLLALLILIVLHGLVIASLIYLLRLVIL
jgi:hypothetical protein